MEVMTRLSRKVIGFSVILRPNKSTGSIAARSAVPGIPYLSVLYNIGLNPFGNSNSFKLTE